MAKPTTPPDEVRQRRRAWAYARKQCAMTNTEIARIVGRSPDTVKAYGKTAGSVPTWDAIRMLQAWNLNAAFDMIAERYGPNAVKLFREEAR